MSIQEQMYRDGLESIVQTILQSDVLNHVVPTMDEIMADYMEVDIEEWEATPQAVRDFVEHRHGSEAVRSIAAKYKIVFADYASYDGFVEALKWLKIATVIERLKMNISQNGYGWEINPNARYAVDAIKRLTVV